MKAFEVMATLQDKTQLVLDDSLDINTPSRVKVILLVSDPNETDPDDTPVDEIKASLKQALKEAKAGQRLSLEEMWEGIDAE